MSSSKPLIVGAALFILTLHCGPLPESTLKRYQYTQLHLGVQVRIVLFAQKEAIAKEAARAVFEKIAALEDVFSDYREHSELRRLAVEASEAPVRVSDPLYAVLQHAVALSAETDGAFDITVGPLTTLWRKARQTGALPPADSLAEARRRVGWRHIRLDDDTKSVRLSASGMLLDAGGLAKGFILDRALETLEDAGVTIGLIEAGGDVVVGAAPPGADGWNVSVPDAPESSHIRRRAQSLSHAAIATSGDTEQFLEIDGIRYSHVVDPRTGLGVQSRRAATVIAPNGITADGYATALTVMSPAAADSLLALHPELTAFVRIASAE